MRSFGGVKKLKRRGRVRSGGIVTNYVSSLPASHFGGIAWGAHFPYCAEAGGLVRASQKRFQGSPEQIHSPHPDPHQQLVPWLESWYDQSTSLPTYHISLSINPHQLRRRQRRTVGHCKPPTHGFYKSQRWGFSIHSNEVIKTDDFFPYFFQLFNLQ